MKNITRPNIIVVPKSAGKKKGKKDTIVLKKIMAKMFHNLMKNVKVQI